MVKKYLSSVFIFRNDLRLQDNTALIHALKSSKVVFPIFFQENLDCLKVKNDNLKQFIFESLVVLDNQLRKFGSKLIILNKLDNLKTLIQKNNIDTVFINKFYHPVHIKQEKKIEKLCKSKGLDFNIFHDFLLHEPCSVKPNGDQCAYKVFAPFFNKAKKLKIELPIKNVDKNFFKGKVKVKSIDIKKLALSLKNINENLHKQGGFVNAQKVLKNLGKYKNYKKEHNFPALNATTKLSAYINTGCVSIRQVYHAILKKLGKNHDIIRQLYWREFYYHLYYAFPELFKNTLKKPKVKWIYNRSVFNKWKIGKTGVDIVDAAMNQINVTGFMHNRCRMIVSNFLALKMRINWKWGEKYFAQKLTDYDPILNNGNWQYMAQVGADTAGYLRILNPVLQQKKYDKDLKYIHKWLNKKV